MLLGTDPYMAVTPFAEVAQLLHLGMAVLDVVLLWQAGRVVDSHIAAESEENPGCFVR